MLEAPQRSRQPQQASLLGLVSSHLLKLDLSVAALETDPIGRVSKKQIYTIGR